MIVVIPQHHGKSSAQIEQERIIEHKAVMKRKEAIIVMESNDFVAKSGMTTDEAVVIKEWILADAKVYCMNAGVATKAAPVVATIQQRDKDTAQRKANEAQDAKIFGWAILIIIGFLVACFVIDIFWTGLKERFR